MTTASVTRDAATVTMRRILFFGVALFAVAFSLLGIPQSVADRESLAAIWTVPSFILLLGIPFIIVVGAFVLPVSVLRILAALQIAVFTVALLTWPLSVQPGHLMDASRPWIFGHFAAVVSFAAILLPIAPAWVFTGLASLATGVLRVVAQGPDATSNSVQDALFNLMIGTILVALVQVTVRAGRTRDAAAAATGAALAAAAAIEAKNVQRSRAAAIIHDDVISTLIAAARSGTDSPTLVRSYAAKALGRLDALRAGNEGTGDSTDSSQLAATLRVTAAQLATRVTFSASGPALAIPERVGEAIIEAASEALRNSQRHATESRRAVSFVTTATGVRVSVADDGGGFDIRHIPSERFGIAVSIRDRMSSVGGMSAIESTESGTRVVVEWLL